MPASRNEIPKNDVEDKIGYYVSKNSRDFLVNDMLNRRNKMQNDSESRLDKYYEPPYPSTKNTPSVEDKYNSEVNYLGPPSHEKLIKSPNYGTYHHRQTSSTTAFHSHRPREMLLETSLETKPSAEKNKALNRSLSGDRKNFDRKNMSGGDFARESLTSHSPTNSFTKYSVINSSADPTMLDVSFEIIINYLE
jgi:hypothetical protein